MVYDVIYMIQWCSAVLWKGGREALNFRDRGGSYSGRLSNFSCIFCRLTFCVICDSCTLLNTNSGSGRGGASQGAVAATRKICHFISFVTRVSKISWWNRTVVCTAD